MSFTNNSSSTYSKRNPFQARTKHESDSHYRSLHQAQNGNGNNFGHGRNIKEPQSHANSGKTHRLEESWFARHDGSSQNRPTSRTSVPSNKNPTKYPDFLTGDPLIESSSTTGTKAREDADSLTAEFAKYLQHPNTSKPVSLKHLHGSFFLKDRETDRATGDPKRDAGSSSGDSSLPRSSSPSTLSSLLDLEKILLNFLTKLQQQPEEDPQTQPPEPEGPFNPLDNLIGFMGEFVELADKIMSKPIKFEYGDVKEEFTPTAKATSKPPEPEPSSLRSWKPINSYLSEMMEMLEHPENTATDAQAKDNDESHVLPENDPTSSRVAPSTPWQRSPYLDPYQIKSHSSEPNYYRVPTPYISDPLPPFSDPWDSKNTAAGVQAKASDQLHVLPENDPAPSPAARPRAPRISADLDPYISEKHRLVSDPWDSYPKNRTPNPYNTFVYGAASPSPTRPPYQPFDSSDYRTFSPYAAYTATPSPRPATRPFRRSLFETRSARKSPYQDQHPSYVYDFERGSARLLQVPSPRSRRPSRPPGRSFEPISTWQSSYRNKYQEISRRYHSTGAYTFFYALEPLPDPKYLLQILIEILLEITPPPVEYEDVPSGFQTFRKDELRTQANQGVGMRRTKEREKNQKEKAPPITPVLDSDHPETGISNENPNRQSNNNNDDVLGSGEAQQQPIIGRRKLSKWKLGGGKSKDWRLNPYTKTATKRQLPTAFDANRGTRQVRLVMIASKNHSESRCLDPALPAAAQWTGKKTRRKRGFKNELRSSALCLYSERERAENDGNVRRNGVRDELDDYYMELEENWTQDVHLELLKDRFSISNQLAAWEESDQRLENEQFSGCANGVDPHFSHDIHPQFNYVDRVIPSNLGFLQVCEDIASSSHAEMYQLRELLWGVPVFGLVYALRVLHPNQRERRVKNLKKVTKLECFFTSFDWEGKKWCIFGSASEQEYKKLHEQQNTGNVKKKAAGAGIGAIGRRNTKDYDEAFPPLPSTQATEEKALEHFTSEQRLQLKTLQAIMEEIKGVDSKRWKAISKKPMPLAQRLMIRLMDLNSVSRQADPNQSKCKQDLKLGGKGLGEESKTKKKNRGRKKKRIKQPVSPVL